MIDEMIEERLCKFAPLSEERVDVFKNDLQSRYKPNKAWERYEAYKQLFWLFPVCLLVLTALKWPLTPAEFWTTVVIALLPIVWIMSRFAAAVGPAEWTVVSVSRANSCLANTTLTELQEVYQEVVYTTESLYRTTEVKNTPPLATVTWLRVIEPDGTSWRRGVFASENDQSLCPPGPTNDKA